MGTNFSEELDFVKDIICKAGSMLLEFYSKPGDISTKDDGSLVSDADRRVSEYLFFELIKAFPKYAILDEERKEDGSRFDREYCWFVDPLDGTRDYLKRGNDFGVIIGLTRNFQPVLGITYKPQTDELVYAIKGQGAYINIDNMEDKILVNNSTESRVLISNTRTSAELEEMIRRIKPNSLEKMGGSLKVIEVAKGNATLFLCPTTSIMHLWDLCATSLILEEAGGKITDIYGNDFDYSQRQTSNVNGVLASNGRVHECTIDIFKGM